MRAVGGVRLSWSELPAWVRNWVNARYGEPLQATSQSGGMSSGCALRLLLPDGRRVFVKAVSETINQGTAELFRYERSILEQLARVPYRACLLDAFDDQGWVGLLLEDIEGRHPTLDHPDDYERVRSAVEEQSQELSVVPEGLTLTTMAASAIRWSSRWDALVAEPSPRLPAWAVPHAGELHERVRRLPPRLDGAALCHWDVREDNVLIRPDGSVVFVDWGMARRGLTWIDRLCLALHHVRTPTFDQEMAAVAEPDLVTDVLVALAGSQGWMAGEAAPDGVPGLPAYRAADAERLWAGVARRLG